METLPPLAEAATARRLRPGTVPHAALMGAGEPVALSEPWRRMPATTAAGASGIEAAACSAAWLIAAMP
jgi:hypothetical protein